jgi:predicted nucleic acid-binding protein
LSTYLLDTDVVSAFAPAKAKKPAIEARVADWFDRNAERLFLSAVTAIELEAGLLKLGRVSPGRRHSELSRWFEEILADYEKRILPLDTNVARIASQITDRSKAAGAYPGLSDVAIAATAIANDMTLLTRNLRHFSALGVNSVDPFDRLPT